MKVAPADLRKVRPKTGIGKGPEKISVDQFMLILWENRVTFNNSSVKRGKSCGN
jgi:hypothetical protein